MRLERFGIGSGESEADGLREMTVVREIQARMMADDLFGFLEEAGEIGEGKRGDKAPRGYRDVPILQCGKHVWWRRSDDAN